MLEDEFLNLASVVALKQIGLDLQSVGVFILQTAIEKRMRHCGLELGDYALRLERNLNEQKSLCQLLLISESWFERELEPLDLAIEKLSIKSSDINVLSIPCARGEEPITILSSALRAGIPISNINIEGYDASKSAIEQAKLFSFGEYSFRGTSESFRINYFKQCGPRFTLRSEFRNVFKFGQANIAELDWKPMSKKYDLIVCRNLLIYLESKVQQQLLLKLKNLLAKDGLLLLGSAEACLASAAGFENTPESTLIFRNREGARGSFQQSINAPKAVQTTSRIRNSLQFKSVKTNIHSSAKALHSSKDNKNNKAYNFELADRGELDEAFSHTLEAIENNPHDANNYYLLGLISSSVGKLADAKFWILKALDLDPQHEEAELFFNSLITSQEIK